MHLLQSAHPVEFGQRLQRVESEIMDIMSADIKRDIQDELILVSDGQHIGAVRGSRCLLK